MRGKSLVVFLIILMLSANTWVFADSSAAIVLDGSFADWGDKPFVEDPMHDIKSTWDDFLGVAYFADDQYLYLKVERLSANKAETWHFNVVMLNAVKGQQIVHYPYGNEAVYAPQFDILTYYDERKNQDGAVVEVSFEGQVLESTLSSDNNAKVIEFRVPLKSVALDGMNKDIQFLLKSDMDEEVIDWVPDGRPIIVTTGPTLYEVSTIAFFAFVSFMAYKSISRVRKKGVSVN